jgi:hypothetical protein
MVWTNRYRDISATVASKKNRHCEDSTVLIPPYAFVLCVCVVFMTSQQLYETANLNLIRGGLKLFVCPEEYFVMVCFVVVRTREKTVPYNITLFTC